MKYKILPTLYKFCTCPRTSKLKFSTCPERNGTRSDKSGMVFPQPCVYSVAHKTVSDTFRHVKINGSPVSLTENSAVFRKTDFKKKSQILKNPLIVLPFFLLKAISCDNLAAVAKKNQYCILARPDNTC